MAHATPDHSAPSASQAEATAIEAEAQASLKASRRLAGGLLVSMGGVMVLSAGLPALGVMRDSYLLEVLRSGARAGVVGGIADWFAVTALFRHPLGLPIPHTAVLPRQQPRLARALGRFVSTQFFTEEDASRALASADVARLLANLLRQPRTASATASALRRSVPDMLDRLEDGRASAAIAKALPVLVGGETSIKVVTRSLRALVDNELHQEVLSALLERFKAAVQKREATLRSFIEERVREQGGRMIGWAIGPSVANRVITALYMELDRVDPQDSDIREGFTGWIRQEIDRLEEDPERRARFGNAISGYLGHDSLKLWWSEIWQRFRGVAEADLASEEGWSRSVIETALLSLADQLDHDPGMRARLEQTLKTTLVRVLPSLRDKLAVYIASVMERWDPSELSARLEQRVGRDLQYIRINGTVVGFVVGAVLDMLMQLCFGHLG
ncbi:DUF445 domain-containing protein [Asaia astilbis]|uniref:DUF445 domain-containing protein n=1 Tax=Asaia astilbis TaxID=610244 RepID=UPI00046FA4D3|nr:DUF445 domain-containing protein [Asaia astilbis]